jgi:hypothetical protein
MKRPFALVLLLAGCAPHDAEITGTWFSWLAANSSATVMNEEISNLAEVSTIYECQRGWDPDEDRMELGYVGPETADESLSETHIGGACFAGVTLETDRNGAVKYDDDGNPLYTPRETEEDAEGNTKSFLADYCLDDNGDPNDEVILHEINECIRVSTGTGWTSVMGGDGYYSFQKPIEPWRTEAIINGEGQLQVTAHVDIDGKDFHFLFTIKPDFAPSRCVSDENGNASIEPVDGDWLEEWSKDEDGHTIYYLNAGGIQSPDGGDTQWYVVTDWSSGFGYGNLEGEEMLSVPATYTAAEMDLNDLTNLEPYDAAIQAVTEEGYQEVRDSVEMAGAFTGSAEDPSWIYEVRVEDNTWRPLDELQSGYDAWVELHRSWVRVKSGSKIEVDGQVEGDFQYVLAGVESGSRVVLQGTFKVDRIREDKWAYNFLEDDLRATEDWGNEFCK